MYTTVCGTVREKPIHQIKKDLYSETLTVSLNNIFICSVHKTLYDQLNILVLQNSIGSSGSFLLNIHVNFL